MGRYGFPKRYNYGLSRTLWDFLLVFLRQVKWRELSNTQPPSLSPRCVIHRDRVRGTPNTTRVVTSNGDFTTEVAASFDGCPWAALVEARDFSPALQAIDVGEPSTTRSKRPLVCTQEHFGRPAPAPQLYQTTGVRRCRSALNQLRGRARPK